MTAPPSHTDPLGTDRDAALSLPPHDLAATLARHDPRWVRPALLGLLGTTALLYLWGLGASGYANTFYSAAAQAGATSWKAFFFGSSDAANSIMVDKPPGSLWVMDLSARIFGMHGGVGGDGRFGGPGGGGFGGQHGGSSSSRQIAAWVQQNFTATRVGNAAVYDLTVER